MNMSNLKNVTILPWVHDIQIIEHHALINYIKKLPKAQNILIEEASLYQNVLDIMMDVLKGKDIHTILKEKQDYNSKNINEKYLSFHMSYEDTYAAMDLLMVCRERGHTIIPLESNIMQMGVVNNKSISVKFRDNLFIKNILSTLTTKDNLFVISGAGHCESLTNRIRSAFKKRFPRYQLVLKNKLNLIYSISNFKKQIAFIRNNRPRLTKYSDYRKELRTRLIEIENNKQTRAIRKRLERVIKDSKIPLKKKKLGISALRKHMSPRPK